MDLSSRVEGLRRELAALAEAGGGEQARALVERLTGSLEPAIRLTLLDALSAAVEDISRDLAPGSVELRLRGREPAFVVTPPPAPAWGTAPGNTQGTVPADAPDADGEEPDADQRFAEDGPAVRINLRIPEPLKAAVEEAAAREGRSVNAWLTRAATAALQQRPDRDPRAAAAGGTKNPKRFTGWVR
jgi:hypothetical protein